MEFAVAQWSFFIPIMVVVLLLLFLLFDKHDFDPVHVIQESLSRVAHMVIFLVKVYNWGSQFRLFDGLMLMILLWLFKSAIRIENIFHILSWIGNLKVYNWLDRDSRGYSERR